MIPLRIAHVIQRYPPALGGAESYFARLSSYLARQGEQVQVQTSSALALEAFWCAHAKHLPPSSTLINNVRVQRHAIRYLPVRKLFLKGLSLIPLPWVQGLALPAGPQMPSLWSLARRSTIKIDLIHASAFPYSFPLFCALHWARRLKVPFCLTPFLHLGDPADSQDRTRRSYLSPPLLYLLQAADRVFVQTRLERDAVLQQNIPAEKVVLQGLGVDPAECTGGVRDRADQRWSLPKDELVRIGHLANLSHEKGTLDLLRAVSLLLERGINCRVILAGPTMPNFRRFWKHVPAQVRQQVHLLGVLREEDKPDFYASIDLFALPSRSDSFGLVLLEAWANALPCIGYRAGGIAEVIRHEQDGLLARCGDLDELAGQLQRLIQNPAYRTALGHSGRQKTLSEHRWAEKLNRVHSEYHRLVRRS